jgi:hypothetical protein
VHRLLSVSESSTLLDCPWRHALAYTGQLTDGDALAPKTTPLLLREGKAWGRAMAALHGSWNRTTQRVDAVQAVRASLAADAEQRGRAGIYDPDAEATTERHVLAVLDHYISLTEPLPLHHPERHLILPLPAAERHSNRYRLEVYLDGLHDDEWGSWVVEFKWRASNLIDFEIATFDRQLRWYAWAWREHLGIEPVGVILDERIGEEPSPVRFNQDGRVSKIQSCTPEAYMAAGGDDLMVATKLSNKQWQARRRITFRPGELDWAGRELRTVARLVHMYDNGQLAPMRNANPRNCRGCRFRAICADPFDRELVDALYDRVPAKRDREEEIVHA